MILKITKFQKICIDFSEISPQICQNNFKIFGQFNRKILANFSTIFSYMPINFIKYSANFA